LSKLRGIAHQIQGGLPQFGLIGRNDPKIVGAFDQKFVASFGDHRLDVGDHFADHHFEFKLLDL
jgi:hypothetical protein